jgi:release factor glutamine methyltransferase
MTLQQLEQYFIEQLNFLYDTEETKQLFYLTVDHVSGYRRNQIMGNSDTVIVPEEYSNYQNILSALKEGRPLQHIFAEAWFYGLKFRVNSSVLIPRPETEELVQWILETITDSSHSDLLDIGTGSGCIAIALKKKKDFLQVDALDISTDALQIAAENAALNSTAINFIQSDILAYEGIKRYDFIVSNPPYITQEERKDMHQNVLSYEPELALFVSNENPLIFYKSIAGFAARNLRHTGFLFFEINEYLGKEMVDMLAAKGFTNIELRKDMQGKDRMIRCRLSSGPGMKFNDNTL